MKNARHLLGAAIGAIGASLISHERIAREQATQIKATATIDSVTFKNPIRQEKRNKYSQEYMVRQTIINQMTNWQRAQAGKFCNGNWNSLSLDQLKVFLQMPRTNEAREIVSRYK